MPLGGLFGLEGRTAIVVGGDASIRDVVASALTNAGAETSSVPCDSFDPSTPAESNSADIVVLNCCLHGSTDGEGSDQAGANDGIPGQGGLDESLAPSA